VGVEEIPLLPANLGGSLLLELEYLFCRLLQSLLETLIFALEFGLFDIITWNRECIIDVKENGADCDAGRS
jgi:hypothetical protein